MGQNRDTGRSEDNREWKAKAGPQPSCLAPATWLSITLLAMAVVVGAQEDRKLIHKVDPEYPAIARKLNLQGTVRVEVCIASDGSVKSVATLGGNPILAQAVETAVKQWKYATAPADAKKILEFKF
jgi:TonB family protein